MTGAIEPRRLRSLAALPVVLGVTEALQPRLGVAPPPSVAP